MKHASGQIQNKGLHVIISTSPINRQVMTTDMMDDILQHFIKETYANALVYGNQHREMNLHGHLLVSGNELFGRKSTRLTKEGLRSAYFNMLDYIKAKYPQVVIGINEKEYGKRNFSEREYYAKKRSPGILLDKTQLTERVKGIFSMARSTDDFFKLLQKENLPTYLYKDNVQGVVFENRKFRFSRLGIQPEKLQELDIQNVRMQELERIRFRGSKTRIIER
jgi:hypothetical protein